MKKKALIFVIILFSLNSFGDEYLRAFVKQYKSQNGLYILTVYPTQIPKNYNKEIKKRKRYPEKYINKSLKDTIIPCYAILSKRISRDELLTETVWKRDLVNSTAPQEVYVSNDGEFVVTFDDWFYSGKGENVMVVYDEKGNKLQSYKLFEISPFPLNDLVQTISSIYWFFGVENYSEFPKAIEILVINRKNQIMKKRYSLTELKFETIKSL